MKPMRRTALILLGLAILSIGVFAQTREFAFINYDDPGHVSGRPELRSGLSWTGVRWVFTTTFVANYIPITGLTFLADYSVHDLEPGGYHVTNGLLHTANGLLLFLFLARTTGAPWCSAIVAALFLVHPLRAESVAWISSRKDLTCGLFWMLTLHAYVSYARKPAAGRYAAVFVGTCLALLSKPMAVTLPCVLLLLDFWPLRRIRTLAETPSLGRGLGWLALEKAPLFVPVVAASVATLLIQRDAGAVSSVDQLDVGARVFNALLAYLMYIVRTLVPWGLIPHYPYFEATGGEMAAFAVGVGLSGLAVTLFVLLAYRRYPWVFTGWFWYLGTLVPVIGIVQVGTQSSADRYTYLPQIGLFVLVIWSIQHVAQRVRWGRVIALATAILAIVGYAAAAYRQTGFWRDSITLWSHAVEISPNNPTAHSSLGKAYLENDDLENARIHIEEALFQKPGHRPALLNLAQIYVQQDNVGAALDVCKRLVAIRPDDPDAHTTWSSILIRRGEPQAALEHADTALGADPNHADALINRSAALLLLGRAELAAESAQRATYLAPDDPAAFTNLATASLALGRAGDARRYCKRALELDPAYRPALMLRGDLDALPE